MTSPQDSLLAARADHWFRRHPRLMLLATVALTVAASIALLFVGHSEPILYQAF